MSKTTLDLIRDIEAKAQADIAKLKQSLHGELSGKLTAAKAQVAKLEAELAALGTAKAAATPAKATRGPKPAAAKAAPAKKVGSRTRRRLTPAEKAKTIDAIKGALSKDKGVPMKGLVAASGVKAPMVRKLLGEVPHKSTGTKASTLYFTK